MGTVSSTRLESGVGGGWDLYEFVSVLSRRRVLVIALLLLTLGTVAVGNALTPSVYRSEALYVLRIEEFLAGEGLRVGIRHLPSLAVSDALLEDVRAQLPSAPDVTSLRSEVFNINFTAGGQLVSVNARGSSAQEAQQYITTWANVFAKTLLDGYRVALQESLLATENSIRALEAVALEVNEKIYGSLNAEGAGPEVLSALAVQSEYAQRLVAERVKYARYTHIGERISHMSPLEALIEPTVPAAPVSPKSIPNLLVGAMIGLLLGIGAALMRESWEVQRARAIRASSTPERTAAH